MSNDQHTPTPVVPWLPAPGPRVAAPPTAAPNPWARMAANNYNPPPKRRKSRVPWRSLLVFVLIALGVGVYRGMTPEDTSTQQVATPVVATSPVLMPATVPAAPIADVPLPVQTEAFSFVLPATPTIKPITAFASDPTITGTQWTLRVNDSPVSVLALTYPFVLDEPAQQAAVDSMAANMAANIKGTVVSDTSATIDGVYQRDVVITSLGGTMVIKCFGKGTWLVMMVGVSTGDEAPIGLAELVASFSFV